MKDKILVIEDDKSVNANLQALLEEEGYQVFAAANGKQGITIAKEIIPNLIICDIMMPEMDGYQVIKELSNFTETNAIPFLFLTAKIEAADLRKGMELGADDYLFKPYKAFDLLKAVKIRLAKYNRIKAVLNSSNNTPGEKTKYNLNDSLFVNVNNKPKFIFINSIKFITAENQYSNLGLTDESNVLIRKSLCKWEEILPNNTFVRIHRSTIINLNYISKVEKWFRNSFKVFLKDSDESFVISKRYASKIKTHL